MPWWGWTLLALYVAGFATTFWFNATVFGNGTLALMLLRSAVWPVYWATGWPQGVPLTMD